MRRVLAVALLVGTATFGSTAQASAGSPKSLLFHDGDVVRTVVPPSPLPKEGTDPFYSVANGVSGQLGIAGVAPGDGPYHGGAWAMNVVTFNEGVTPYLLMSDEAVFAAEAAGDLTVTRDPSQDFRCPVLP